MRLKGYMLKINVINDLENLQRNKTSWAFN